MARKKYTNAQRKAYWIGVGIATERYNESNDFLDSKNPNIRNSIRAGYNDVNYKDVNRNFLRKNK